MIEAGDLVTTEHWGELFGLVVDVRQTGNIATVLIMDEDGGFEINQLTKDLEVINESRNFSKVEAH